MYYILEGKIPKPTENVDEWLACREKNDNAVKCTKLPNNIMVSTIFTGVNYNIFSGAPLVFETKVFGGKYDDYTKHYQTWEEAEKGHEKIVASLFKV